MHDEYLTWEEFYDDLFAHTPNELTLPMTQEEGDSFVAELMEQSYDAACPCMPEIYRGYVRSFPAELWRDEGGKG